MESSLTHLGKVSNEPTRKLDVVPSVGGLISVTLNCSEFKSVCPVTGQPDFGKLVITYTPGERLVETKSLKLYLWSFETERSFNEQIVNSIADDFFEQVQPLHLKVEGMFNPRGGISVSASAERFGMVKP